MASFSTALSALRATTTAIDVVGNNLANLNTTGYKDSTVSFHNLVTQAVGASLDETQVGFGVAPPVTLANFTQGAIQTSNNPLSAAVDGNGFFVVKDASTGATLYTRDGTFKVDANGNLLNATGEQVQGWTAVGGQLNLNSSISTIQVPVGQIRQPIATSNIAVSMNLDASPPANGTPGTFSTSIQTVDSLGNPLIVTANFTQDPTNPLQWTYQLTVPGNTTTGGTPGTPTALLASPGTLVFGADGQLVTPDPTNPIVPITITGLADNAADMNINWHLYDANGQPTLTEFGQPSAVSANSQDGQTSAQLVSVGMSNGGKIEAQYSDGTQQIVGQLALAGIRNPDSLLAVGNNEYEATAKTALPAIGTANTGGRGQILGGSTEASTVDIAQELTNLIVLQSSYQANAKVVTTVDQLSQTTINLKQ
jgi:flagellar hook protein FlgE